MTTCKSCGAAVEWCATPGGGKMPVDLDPSEKGNLTVIAGLARPRTAMDAYLERQARTSHFATCPQAHLWRKK
jgi:hypothetical protein